jgi:hypothetical protein
MDFLAVRIGYFRGLYADPALREAWLHRIWLGPKDCAKFFRLAVAAPSFGYGIAYACSRCPENYLDLTSARALIGYEPEETVPDAGRRVNLDDGGAAGEMRRTGDGERRTAG